MSALSVNPQLTFNELKEPTETTDGNLSVHARKLEEAGYVDCTKAFDGRLPRTTFTLTLAGRRAFQNIPVLHGNDHRRAGTETKKN